jgi:carbon-monoxide dehydrogenase medium subunit
VIPAQFDYEAPATVEEALSLLASAGDREVKVLAGGQSLLPVLRLRMAAPDLVVDLSRISDLRGVRDEGDVLAIGAMTTHDDVTREPLIRQHALLLAEAAGTVADPQVRHRGTFGGALAHADPAGDMPAPALALDAQDELLVEVRVPKHTGWGAHYEKFSRVAQAWSIVAVAAAVRVDGGVVQEAKVALTNMGLVPVRASAVEQALIGREATPEAVREAAALAAEGTSPMSDANADEDYRRHLATVLTGRAVLAAAGV